MASHRYDYVAFAELVTSLAAAPTGPLRHTSLVLGAWESCLDRVFRPWVTIHQHVRPAVRGLLARAGIQEPVRRVHGGSADGRK